MAFQLGIARCSLQTRFVRCWGTSRTDIRRSATPIKAIKPGQLYSATVSEDVRDASGGVAIPAGTPAKLLVREIKTGGAVHSPELVVDLFSRAYDNDSGAHKSAKNAEDAEKTEVRCWGGRGRMEQVGEPGGAEPVRASVGQDKHDGR